MSSSSSSSSSSSGATSKRKAEDTADRVANRGGKRAKTEVTEVKEATETKKAAHLTGEFVQVITVGKWDSSLSVYLVPASKITETETKLLTTQTNDSEAHETVDIFLMANSVLTCGSITEQIDLPATAKIVKFITRLESLTGDDDADDSSGDDLDALYNVL